MKRISLFFILSTILFNLCLTAATAAPQVYTLDPSHTYVLWRINHFGFSTQAGKWYATGTLTLDKEKPENSKVEATIDIKNMITGLPELDKHLSGMLFFNTSKYPKATFVSDKVVMTGKDTAKVFGKLTLRGETQPVTLDVKLNNTGVSPVSNKESAGFSATADIKRSAFGIKTAAPGLSDDVKLYIDAEAFLPNVGS